MHLVSGETRKFVAYFDDSVSRMCLRRIFDRRIVYLLVRLKEKSEIFIVHNRTSSILFDFVGSQLYVSIHPSFGTALVFQIDQRGCPCTRCQNNTIG